MFVGEGSGDRVRDPVEDVEGEGELVKRGVREGGRVRDGGEDTLMETDTDVVGEGGAEALVEALAVPLRHSGGSFGRGKTCGTHIKSGVGGDHPNVLQERKGVPIESMVEGQARASLCPPKRVEGTLSSPPYPRFDAEEEEEEEEEEAPLEQATLTEKSPH